MKYVSEGRVLKYFFPSLKQTKGNVAVISSLAARSYSQFSGIEYTASKAALSGIVRQLAIEWSDDGIFINSVFPSMTSTPMLKENINNEERDKLKNNLPLMKLERCRLLQYHEVSPPLHNLYY